MKLLLLIFLVQAVLQTIYLPASQGTVQPMDARLIEQTCKQTPLYNLCVSILKSDSRSSKADVTGLALIMVDVLKAKATGTRNYIKRLLRGNLKRDVRHGLSSCAEVYNSVLEADVPVAIEALQKGNPKFAEQAANDAAIEASSCERSFSGHSPLTKSNKSMQDVSSVAAAIVRLLL
ncbi:hypothetical protein F2P56_014843 [Juglans regia]|uniref:Pectinesterase inhibitor domain-containing protein n=2 Tax=Juglans regia TaxID=51240 RepID=A0A833XE15_JUGRE|nr:cell wall / vacuolar inhibitor of fructosidase 1-like [Juglans regia]KAF5464791.1 hypothetical protein F2P56_014843 [Juglans regia]